MNNQRLLIGAAWLASLIAVYFIGGLGNSTGNSSRGAGAGNSTQNVSGAAAEGAPKGDRVYLRKAGDLAVDGDPGSARPSVQTIIARARMEFRTGMGGMMNFRQMLRAIAPLAELDDAQLQEALGEVEKTVRDPQQKMMFYSILLGQWAESDGKAAMAYAEEKLSGNPMMDFGVKGGIVGAWARRDPDAAWRWFQTERKPSENEQRDRMQLTMIFAGMAGNNLDTALSRLEGLDDQSRAMALSGIANSATDETSRRRLLDRATSLPTEQKNQLRQGLIQQWVMMDADEALKWVRSLPSDEQKPLRDSAGSMMMMMRPAAGADLLLEGAEEKDKPGIYDRVVGQWAFQDSRAAGEWLMKQPQGPDLDGARRTYAMAVAQKDPAAAMDWAKSVQNDEQRALSVEQIFQQWRGKDAAAAEAALDTAGIPAEKIKQLKESKPPEKATATGVRRFGF
jgi:hypothetical protein